MSQLTHLRSLNYETMIAYIDKAIKDPRNNKKFADSSVPFTNMNLVEDMCQRISDQSVDISIAVMYTVETAVYLMWKGYTNITIITKDLDNGISQFATAYGIKYILLDGASTMKFDAIVGNPPYEKGLAHSFMDKVSKMLNDGGTVSFIVPSGFMTQPSQQKLRTNLLKQHGFRYIRLLPAGTFKTYNNKDVLRQTVLYVAQRGYTGETTYYREGGLPYNVSLSTNGAWNHFYNKVSHGIWLKAQAYHKKMHVQCWNSKTYDPNMTCVHFAEKTDALYVSRITTNNSIRNSIKDPKFGASIHTGVISSITAAPTAKQLSSKRAYVITSVPDQVVKWMNSHLYGVLLSIATTTQDITKASVGSMPLIELQNFTEELAYDELSLSLDEREWLLSVRV